MSKRIELVQRLDFIVDVCRGKNVLHLGCTNWPYTEQSITDGMLLHATLTEICSELHGMDSDENGLELLRSKGFGNLFNVGLENVADVDLDRTFDVIVAGEVIEHLNNPGLFLSGIKKFMTQDTRLVITTINAYCATRFVLYGLKGRHGRSEPVHPDHVAYYSLSTLSLLVSRHGLKVQDLVFYDIGREHRPFNPFYVNLFNDVAVRVSPQLSDGLIAVCVLA